MRGTQAVSMVLLLRVVEEMRTILGIAIVALLAVLASAGESEEFYSDKYDYIDANDILANDRLRDQYYACFMDAGPCTTADMMFFKGNFPEVMATKCRRCTERQKQNFDKMADWYTKNEPEKWDAFVQKNLNTAKEKNAGS